MSGILNTVASRRLMLSTFGCAALGFATASARATAYTGNGATGFGGTLGNASLSVTDDDAGNVTFALTPASPLGNLVVLYVDGAPGNPDLSPSDTPGAFSSTATLLDNTGGDGSEPTAISGAEAANASDGGAPTRSTVVFPTGFYASYAVVFKSDYADVFKLPSQTNSAVAGDDVYEAGQSAPTAPANTTYSVTFPLADIGVTQGGSFDFLGTLISGTAYRSNETIGTSVTTPDPAGSGANAGFDGTQTFSTYDVYATTAPAPEPASLGLLGVAAALGLRRKGRKAR